MEIVLPHDQIASFADARMRHGLQDVPAYVELPRGQAWTEELAVALQKLSLAGLCGKIRCGGLEAAAFPSAVQVAGFVREACARSLSFKATAGLHHPVRRFDREIGAYMHGFLNLLACVGLAHAGAADDTLVGALECEDTSAFAIDERGFHFADVI